MKLDIEKMAEDKKRIQAYLTSGDESKRPRDINFVKPEVISAKSGDAFKRLAKAHRDFTDASIKGIERLMEAKNQGKVE